jgi:hypothetical protein
MEYYYIIDRKCFRGKSQMDSETLNSKSKYIEWRSKLRRIYVDKDDLSDLMMNLRVRKIPIDNNLPIDFTDYILQNRSS